MKLFVVTFAINSQKTLEKSEEKHSNFRASSLRKCPYQYKVPKLSVPVGTLGTANINNSCYDPLYYLVANTSRFPTVFKSRPEIFIISSSLLNRHLLHRGLCSQRNLF